VRRIAPASALVACLLVGALAEGSGAHHRDASPPGEAGDAVEAVEAQRPPNVVVIMSDDQAISTFNREAMPRTFERIVDRGTLFDDFVVSTPMCCPSRAGFLTGQYGHNNGVLTNWPGYPAMQRPKLVLPVWMRHAGYRTSFFGKWLHGYDDAVGRATDPAPGWGRWARLLAPARYQRYDLSIDGRRRQFGRAPRAYLTTRLTQMARREVERHSGRRRPLFMWVSHLASHSARAPQSACHRTAVPAAGDEALFADAPLPQPPSFNEADVSDKPFFLQRLDLLDEGELLRLEHSHRCRLAAMAALDRGVEELFQAFRRAGELGRTVFVFTGDNGYFQGEHRLRRGKGLPYEEAIRQPLAVRVPRRYRSGAPRVPLVERTVTNVDLAPTFLDLAGAEPCHPNGACRALDGRSLVPLIAGRGASWPADRAVPVEMSNPVRGSGRRGEAGSCEYTALRTSSVLYVEHTRVFEPDADSCVVRTEVERYDLRIDPWQLANLHPPVTVGETTAEADLAWRLRSLRRCAGTAEAPVQGSPPCE
jgi:arylsulfatase A-like enzyme